MPAKAIGLSVAMNVSTERFRSSASRCSTLVGFENPKAEWKARPPTNRKELKEHMMGCATAEMKLELPEGTSDEKVQ